MATSEKTPKEQNETSQCDDAVAKKETLQLTEESSHSTSTCAMNDPAWKNPNDLPMSVRIFLASK